MKQKLEETKAKLKANSKDAHFADTLISDLLSLKGQIDHKPTLAYIAIDDIDQELNGDTFTMAILKDGSVVYKVYGGYTVIADPRVTGLNETIRNYIRVANGDIEIQDAEKEDVEVALEAMRYVLSAPMYAFSSDDIMYTIATDIVRWINATAEAILNQDLADEDAQANIEFEDRFKFLEFANEADIENK